MNIRKLVEEGRAKLLTAEDEIEKSKVGVYRVGSGGIYLATGETAGTCHRIALARYFGIQQIIESNRYLMFSAGKTNEDIWAREMKAQGKYKVLQESECPVEFKTAAGTLVTGRPDMVLATEEPLPTPDGKQNADHTELSYKHGLEFKLVSSIWTARDVRFQSNPKFPHVIQSATYSLALDIPFSLCYTNRTDFTVPDWQKGTFSLEDECVEPDRSGKPGKVNPFDEIYTLDWEDDTLFFIQEKASLSEGFRPTQITKEGIKNFFEFLDYCKDNNEVGPRPVNLKIDGSKLPWDKCDPKYCPFATVCDKNCKKLDEWIDQIAPLGKDLRCEKTTP
jgi:hypothetical protein